MNNDKTPEYVNIESGLITDMTTTILNERFLLGGLLYEGANSFVFKCQDTSKSEAKKMVVKIFQQDDEITNEIKMLIKLRKI